ncbi:MAG TPA: serine/threonine-protein kinase, partial [Ktedonobacteraceae bacterium]
ASVLSALHHPQIPQIYDQFNDQDHWYLVLQYLEGPTLETYLETREAQGKPLQFDEVLRIALQLSKVLNYLHTRQPPVIFRDLKPSNIICTLPFKIPCLVDFGIARRFRPGQKRDTQALGSPGYAAPEQYGRAQTTPRSDIYSLGALIHHLLSGHDPAESLPGLVPLRLRSETGEDTLSELVQRMLSADPEQRPDNVREVIATLESIKQQREAQPIARIWHPPVPQNLPASTGGQQLQQQISLALSPAPARTLKQSRPGRRKVLKGLGTTLALTGLGSMIWWASAQSNTTNSDVSISSIGINRGKPPFQKLPGTAAMYIYRGHTNFVTAIAWSPGGEYIASGSVDGTVQIWDATTGKTILTYRVHAISVTAVAWSPDSKHIVSGSDNGTIQIWDAVTGETILTYLNVGYDVNAIAWSPDGAYIVSGSTDGVARVWDTTVGKIALSYRGHTASVLSVAWSPDGEHIVSGSLDDTVQIWDAATGQKTVLLHPASTSYDVNAVAWSPDSKFIVSGSIGDATRIWDAITGDMIRIYPEKVSHVTTVAWSPNGLYIAFSGEDKRVYVWDATDGETVIIYQGHTAPVCSVAWSPDSKHIISGSEDNTVRIWDAPYPKVIGG